VRALFGSREVVTVLTSTWHERDAAALVFPCGPGADRPRTVVRRTRLHRHSLSGWEAYPGREGHSTRAVERAIRAVIAGDTLITSARAEIPANGYRKASRSSRSRRAEAPLLDKPVECVPARHGEPADRAASNAPSPIRRRNEHACT